MFTNAVNSAFHYFLLVAHWLFQDSKEVQRLLDSASLDTPDTTSLLEPLSDAIESHIEVVPEDSFENATPQLFVLIVGINKYQLTKINKLHASVRDAKAIESYLRDELKVPATRIRFLADDQATRANIIENLEFIERGPQIRNGDPILFYFAGHGAQAIPPPGSEDPTFEVLVTHDFGPETPGIPDRELCKLLNNIAKKKGNNITVVLDSCYSASATRGLPAGILARAVDSDLVDYSLHDKICKGCILWDDAHKNISGPQSVEKVTRTRFSQTGLKSHVLLAACKSDEVALESSSGGHFSTALLKLLQIVKLRKTTYSEVMAGIDTMRLMPSVAYEYLPGADVKLKQNPQCVGYYQNRFIFEQTISLRRIIIARNMADKLIIQAGAAEGIVNGDQFGVYHLSDHTRKKKLGILTVTEPSPASSLVTFESQVEGTPCPSNVFAVRCRTGTRIPIKLYAQSDCTGSLLKSLVEDPQNDLDNIHIVSEEAEARITMELSDDASQEVEVRVLPQDIADHQFQPRSHRIPRNYIVHVLQGVVEYFWHLERGGGSQEIADMVKVELFQLQEEDDGSGLHPIYPSLISDGKKPMVKLAVQSDDTYYGLKLTNKSDSQSFYPYLYHFDGTELDIDPFFTSPCPATGGRQVESPLKPRGSITIGYDSAWVDPFFYGIPEGQDADLVTLKILIFTEPIDQQAIPKISTFAADTMPGHSSSQPEAAQARWVRQKHLLQNLRWGSITIPIVLYRSR